MIPLAALVDIGASDLTRDPDVQLFTAQPAGFRSDVLRELSWLTAAGGKVGTTVDLTLGSQAGVGYVLFVGLPGAGLPLANWGDVWLDTRAFVRLDAGTQHPSGRMSLRRAVPNMPGLVGLELTYQVVTGRVPSLTNGATVVLHGA